MFDNGAPFCSDWAAAARTTCDVIQVKAVAPGGQMRPDPRDSRRILVPMPGGRLVSLARRTGLDLQTRRWLAALHRLERSHGRVDLLHGHFYADCRPLAIVSRRLGIPFVVTEHSSALMGGNPDNVLSKAGYELAASVYSRAACVIPVSTRLADRMAELGLPGHRRVLPNPIDTGVFRHTTPDLTRGHRLITVARLTQVKRLDIMLRALAALTRPDVRLTIIGGGPDESALRQLVVTLGLTGQVELLGHLDRSSIARELSRASAACLSSDVENLPVAVIEALCSGLPVLATRVGGLAELVGPGDGLLVPADDVPAFAAGITELLGTAWDREAIAGRAQVRFALEAVGQQLALLYKSITGHD